MSKTRAVWGLVVGLAVALVLAACGGGAGGPEGGSGVETAVVGAEATSGEREAAATAAAGADSAAVAGEPAGGGGIYAEQATMATERRPADATGETGEAGGTESAVAETGEGVDTAETEGDASKSGSGVGEDNPADVLAAAAPEAPNPFLVILDPGHGGDDTGTIGGGVVERESNLDFALRVEQILLQNGFFVLLTRRDARRSLLYPHAQTIPQLAESRTDLQARVDLANRTGANLYVAIHSNRSPNSFQRGVEVWYDPNRDHSLANLRLSGRLLQGVIAELTAYGYPAVTRGILNAECHEFHVALGICLPLFVLAPPAILTRAQVVSAGIPPDRFAFRPGDDLVLTRATEMPAALVELLFVSNAGDVATLRDGNARQAIARGLARAIMAFLLSDDQDRPWEAPDSFLLVG